MKPGRMIPGGMNMQAMMKQAQKLQADMLKKQEELGKMEFTASAGGGVVTATVCNKQITALAIKLEDGGPVFYRQVRVTQYGKTFRIFKFRSMVTNADKIGTQVTVGNDSRITRMGKLIRKCRLDELPQFFCVLAGQMSLVGPRPERPFFYDEFDKYLDGFRQRLLVTPGLTGLAQVSGGYDLDPEEKIVYDVQYIETRSILTDLKIIFKTVAVIFSHDGAH